MKTCATGRGYHSILRAKRHCLYKGPPALCALVEFSAAYANDSGPGAEPQIVIIILDYLFDRITRQTLTRVVII